MGGVSLARLTCVCALLGLCLVIIPLPIWLVLPGFALVGFGVSAAYPLGVSAIAALDDTYEAANIAIMATVAMGGFLIGPPLIGFVSEAFGLRVGFATLVPALILALALTRWLRPANSVGESIRLAVGRGETPATHGKPIGTGEPHKN